MPIIQAPKDDGNNKFFSPKQNAYSVLRAENFGKFGNGSYAFGNLEGYWPLLYDPTSIAVPFSDGGLKWAGMPDIYNAPWLVAIGNADGTDLYNYETLAVSNSIVDQRNGMDRSNECNPQPNVFPDDTSAAVMFSAQDKARSRYLNCILSNYRTMNTPFYLNQFYCWPNFPHFNPSTIGQRGNAYPKDPLYDPGLIDWLPYDTEMTVNWCPSGGDGPWNFGGGGCVATKTKNRIQLDNGLLPTCHFVNDITFAFVDPKTKDLWYFTAFGDVVTRTCYITSARNQTAFMNARNDCYAKKLNYIKALANAIGDTIKGIVKIIVGVFTFNVGTIVGGVTEIVQGWYNFSKAKEQLEESLSNLNRTQGEGGKGLDIAGKLYGIKGDILNGNVRDIFNPTPAEKPSNNVIDLLKKNGNKLAPIVLVGAGVFALAA